MEGLYFNKKDTIFEHHNVQTVWYSGRQRKFALCLVVYLVVWEQPKLIIIP